MKVNVEDVLELHKQLAKINKVPFKNIEWLLEGVPLTFTKEQVDFWRFTGLSNTSFTDFLNENGEFIVETLQ